MKTENRSLQTIARDIYKNWQKGGKPNVNYAAKPYLEAMLQLDSIRDNYFCDSADSVVRYFLCNATTWRGEDARRIKKELKGML